MDYNFLKSKKSGKTLATHKTFKAHNKVKNPSIMSWICFLTPLVPVFMWVILWDTLQVTLLRDSKGIQDLMFFILKATILLDSG